MNQEFKYIPTNKRGIMDYINASYTSPKEALIPEDNNTIRPETEAESLVDSFKGVNPFERVASSKYGIDAIPGRRTTPGIRTTGTAASVGVGEPIYFGNIPSSENRWTEIRESDLEKMKKEIEELKANQRLNDDDDNLLLIDAVKACETLANKDMISVATKNKEEYEDKFNEVYDYYYDTLFKFRVDNTKKLKDV